MKTFRYTWIFLFLCILSACGTPELHSGSSSSSIIETEEPVMTPWVEQAPVSPNSSYHLSDQQELVFPPDTMMEKNILIVNLDNFWNTKKEPILVHPNEKFVIRRTSTFNVKVTYNKDIIDMINGQEAMGSEITLSIPEEGDTSIVFEYLLNHSDKNLRAEIFIHSAK